MKLSEKLARYTPPAEYAHILESAEVLSVQADKDARLLRIRISLPFLVSKKDLQTFFQKLYPFVEPNGVFVFDAKTKAGFAQAEGTRIGDKVRIIPVHICPVCNLYDKAYLLDGDEVTAELDVACRGRLR